MKQYYLYNSFTVQYKKGSFEHNWYKQKLRKGHSKLNKTWNNKRLHKRTE